MKTVGCMVVCVLSVARKAEKRKLKSIYTSVEEVLTVDIVPIS